MIAFFLAPILLMMGLVGAYIIALIGREIYTIFK